MGDFRDREGFLSVPGGGKMGLRSFSGGTFRSIREYFLGPSGDFLRPGESFFGSVGYFISMCMLFYQLVPTFSNFYELLHQSFSISIRLYEPFSIVLHLYPSLTSSTNLYRFLWTPIFTNSYESPSTLINGYRSASANLYQSLPIPIYL